ncbi:uncharacterized protein UBRO_20179 [Ustilago bromivora]|uniref:Uncharacterized protein n=1 Tax=Ustilago bromivora TaxID=307758 RepID=A0A1K0GCJ3_9BASI|nr:uncharacterized protein UBRO_20179 [Ustilago bromivora]
MSTILDVLHTSYYAAIPRLLGSTTTQCWLPTSNTLLDSGDNDGTTLSLPPFSRQQEATLPTNGNSESTSYSEWDQTMSKIREAGKIVIDMDAICADLHGQLDKAIAEGGISTNLEGPCQRSRA